MSRSNWPYTKDTPVPELINTASGSIVLEGLEEVKNISMDVVSMFSNEQEVLESIDPHIAELKEDYINAANEATRLKDLIQGQS